MHLTIREAATGRTYVVSVEASTTIEVVVLKLAAAHAINYNDIRLFGRGVLLDRGATVAELGLSERESLVLERPRQKSPLPNGKDLNRRANSLLKRYLSSPSELDQLSESDSELFEAIVSESTQRVAALLRKRQPNTFIEAQGSLLPNELDVEYQRRLEEKIAADRLSELQRDAYEHYPELFVTTEMLFLKGIVNRVETLVFVDTGAQTTIVSREFAECANLLKDVDRRYAGIVVGVGTQKSLGRIWKLALEIGGEHFLLSCTVIESFPHDFLLGLDMMKRHRCVIDLKAFCVSFGENGVRRPFVSDYELTRIREERNRPKVNALCEALGLSESAAKELLERAAFRLEEAIEIGIEERRKREF